MKKTISVLGATGSVGTQALDVARRRGYAVDFMSAARDVRGLERAAREFLPTAVAMADEAAARELSLLLSDTDIRVLSGSEGIVEGILASRSETTVNATLGEAGLMPTLAVIEAGQRLALANKESLVIAGDIVTSRAREAGVEIIPVDSEHSAIFQSLASGRAGEVKRLLLTASGGPFFGYTEEEISRVTLADTLRHPTWKMGRKITVDSATLMNKGFEIIEAHHLFGVPSEKIEVVVHRESILHSAVEYIDNAVVGQMSVPDMRMCVQYAVDYPERVAPVIEPLDLFEVGRLTFNRLDESVFGAPALAKRAIIDGGAMPAVLNAADEVAVGAFLREEIGFSEIMPVVTEVYEKTSDARSAHSLDDIISADRRARALAGERIKRK
ncbi:MAG: 1-deoxy-D-xylulose-5-phosphate reductoisomerase [Clostridia bacterium]|nr:1-deoxy-D-xylulose-5-phosphate reductoisomerase [Clostridia bacterium]